MQGSGRIVVIVALFDYVRIRSPVSNRDMLHRYFSSNCSWLSPITSGYLNLPALLLLGLCRQLDPEHTVLHACFHILCLQTTRDSQSPPKLSNDLSECVILAFSSVYSEDWVVEPAIVRRSFCSCTSMSDLDKPGKSAMIVTLSCSRLSVSWLYKLVEAPVLTSFWTTSNRG